MKLITMNKSNNFSNNIPEIITFIILFSLITFCQLTQKNYLHPKFEIVFAVFIVILGIFLINYFSKNQKDIVKITFITILIFGLLFCFITPTPNTPDEGTHMYRSYLTSEGVLIADDPTYNYTTTEFLDQWAANTINNGNHDKVPKIFTIFNSKILNKPIDITPIPQEKFKSYSILTYSFIGYIPQAIGMKIAIASHLDNIWLIWLPRICNLLFYTGLATYAVKKTPIYKIQLALTATLPMVLYLAASHSIDASIIGYGLIAIAYFLHMLKAPKHSLDLKDATIFCLFSLLCGICKITFIPLIFLLLFVPKENFKTKKDFFIAESGILAVVFAFYLYTAYFSHSLNLPRLENILGLQTSENPASKFNNTSNVDKKELLSFKTMKIIFKSIVLQATDMIPNVLSWPMNNIVYKYLANFYYFIIAILYPENIEENRTARIGTLAVFILIYILTYIALYVIHTLYYFPNSSIVTGMQGRYFLPIIALIPIALSINKNKTFKNMDIWIYTFLLIFLTTSLMTFIIGYY